MSERSRFAVSSKLLIGAYLPPGPRKGGRPVESSQKDPRRGVGKGDSRSNGITRRPQGGRRVSPTSRPKTLPAQSNQRAEPSSTHQKQYGLLRRGSDTTIERGRLPIPFAPRAYASKSLGFSSISTFCRRSEDGFSHETRFQLPALLELHRVFQRVLTRKPCPRPWFPDRWDSSMLEGECPRRCSRRDGTIRFWDFKLAGCRPAAELGRLEAILVRIPQQFLTVRCERSRVLLADSRRRQQRCRRRESAGGQISKRKQPQKSDHIPSRPLFATTFRNAVATRRRPAV